MNASRLVLTVAGTIGPPTAGIGIGAALYASVEPAATTTTVVRAEASGSPERTAATVPGGLSVNAIYERTHAGVVDITVATSRSEAEGSGWVYDTRGDIVTNQHVVSGGGSITVTFPDGSSYSGKLVGTDSSTDLAVVRVSAPTSKLTPLALGNSDRVQVGDPVVAIGSPFGLPGTVTSGIVSALHRSIQAPNDFTIGNSIQ